MSKEPFAKQGRVAQLKATLRGFRRNEEGSLVVFGLVILVLMVMIGGVAVDVMRYEARRTELQNTLDRSTLAAASLTQDLTPTDVVHDYFLKAGIVDTLRSVEVTQGLNFRNVDASAVSDTDPLFLHLMEIDRLDAAGRSTAEQRINNVEIMLVLDVSGSMAANSKLVNLKSAAKSFVDAVLKNDVEHKISIGIVPFNGQVNLGATLAGKFNIVDQHGYADMDCVDLPTASYNTLTLSRTDPLSQTANADTYSGSGTLAPNDANKWCPPRSGNIVRMPIQDIATLQSYIDGLQAVGATSINAGMKWGVALMDPSMQGLYNEYMSAGTMPMAMAGRPLAYDHEDAMKVIVLMTDGEHFAEERVNPAYKTGPSTIWQSSGGIYSVFLASKVNNSTPTTICNSRPYYVTSNGTWQSQPYNGVAPGGSVCYDPTALPASFVNVANRTWPQVWANLNMQYVARNFYATPLASTTAIQTNILRSQTATTSMDDQLQSVCTLAKEQNTLIYGIAFEAPTNGQAQILQCASSPAHYFNATGLQISSAFSAIANNISQLRLTQ